MKGFLSDLKKSLRDKEVARLHNDGKKKAPIRYAEQKRFILNDIPYWNYKVHTEYRNGHRQIEATIYSYDKDGRVVLTSDISLSKDFDRLDYCVFRLHAVRHFYDKMGNLYVKNTVQTFTHREEFNHLAHGDTIREIATLLAKKNMNSVMYYRMETLDYTPVIGRMINKLLQF